MTKKQREKFDTYVEKNIIKFRKRIEKTPDKELKVLLAEGIEALKKEKLLFSN